MRLINLDRAAVGKPALVIDAGLVAIARDARFACPTKPSLVLRGRAADLAKRAYFGHIVKGCYASGTTPYRSLDIVRRVFGYRQARSEILHWNMLGTAPVTYALGCDIEGRSCRGAKTSTPQTVAVAQRNFMSSSPHRTSELAAYRRFGCGTATDPATRKTYFACLFADAGSTSFTPSPTPKPTPAPTPSPDARAEAGPDAHPDAHADPDARAEADPGPCHPPHGSRLHRGQPPDRHLDGQPGEGAPLVRHADRDRDAERLRLEHGVRRAEGRLRLVPHQPRQREVRQRPLRRRRRVRRHRRPAGRPGPGAHADADARRRRHRPPG